MAGYADTIGGSGGPAGGGPSTPAKPPVGMDYSPAYRDAAFRAYMREQGASDAEAQATAARRITSLRQQESLLRPEYADKLMKALDNVSQTFADRGTWRSSNRLNAQADAQGDNAHQMLNASNSLNDQVNNTNADLQSRVAAGFRARMEHALTSSQDVLVGDANYGITPGDGNGAAQQAGPSGNTPTKGAY